MKTNQIWGHSLSIKHQDENGMKLSWNFQGMMDNNLTNYHIFVFFDAQSFNSFQFLHHYYHRMKLGDILGLYNRKRIEWIEKINGISQPFKKNKIQSIPIDFLISTIQSIALKTNKINRGLCFINLLFPQIYQNHAQMEKTISEKRKNKQISPNKIINVITGVEQIKMNGLIGINYFPLNFQNAMEIKQHLSLISVACAQVVIEFKNIEICSQNQQEWRNLDFSTIQRRFYGLPPCNFSDSLLFMSAGGKNIKCRVNVSLEISCTDGNIIKTDKEFEISLNFGKINQRTFIAKSDNFIQSDLSLRNEGNVSNVHALSNVHDKSHYFWITS